MIMAVIVPRLTFSENPFFPTINSFNKSTGSLKSFFPNILKFISYSHSTNISNSQNFTNFIVSPVRDVKATEN